ncbi:MAG: hypothetical protein GEU82_09740 [Luteitalea sp.]|nr:hypothetical protein [Luteitalea sp.]
MNSPYEPVHDLLTRVRSRWRRLLLFQATIRASLAAAGVLGIVLVLARWTSRSPTALAVLGVAAVVLAIVALIWGLWPARERPSDRRVARFVEESLGTLDERLVSAVDVEALGSGDRPALAASMIADAGRAASDVDPAAVVPAESLRRAGFQAVAAGLLLILVVVAGRESARQSFDAIALALFPSRVALEVTPGNARVEAGRGLTVEARLVGNRAPVVAQLLRAAGEAEDWRAVEMNSDTPGRFTLAMESLNTSFRYKVAAGALTSSTFDVTVLRAPRVTRVDVEYTYPKALGLEPRVEQDGGDIYAPAGTSVRVRVHTDRHAATGRMLLAGGKAVDLAPDGTTSLSGSLKVVEDSSYRVALADEEGLASRGETEYFIRTLDDRPPDVHVTKPASDRKVTRLEEVEIEADAQDDYGIESLELVYAVRGGTEKRVPLGIPRRATNVTGRHTLYLEDLDVGPGDFVTYFVRARDVARGKRASETRSDIFFLEVKPFEEEFSLAQSQAAMGGGSGNRQIDDLVAAQKEIIVATWKLDRRSEAARGAQSESDIKSVSRAEAELKARVEETSSSFRESNMRDPRRRPQGTGRGGPPPAGPRAGQMLPEEDAMTAAATAMGKAVTSLDLLKTGDALPPEMLALNHLLKAQADVKKRQVQRQQAAGGGGGNRATQDMSSLFDRELARQQQTNYETPTSTEQKDNQNKSALDAIKELARRQDELLKRHQDMARDRAAMTEEELKRELETLTRDQNELRQRAEELAQQMAREQGQQAGQQGQPGQPGRGEQQPGQSAQGQNGAGPGGQQMREISEEMRSSASELRRQDAGQATERARTALEKLRELERQLQSNTPDGRRRALGDLQLESRQLADAQREIASESSRSRQGESGNDARRRLAGEQDRLAERLQRVQEGLKRQASGAGAAVSASPDAKKMQQAAAEASREIDRQRLRERMQQAAEGMRAGAPASGGVAKGSEAQQEIARALDRLADSLATAEDLRDEESRKLSSQLARAQELRERLDGLSRELDKLGEPGSRPGGNPSSDARAGGQQPDGQPAGRAQGGGEKSPSAQSGQGAGSGQSSELDGPPGSSDDVARLREDLSREIAEVWELIQQMQRDDRTFARGGAGRTFEGQGMTLSAPGTEGFKQDFARWQELRRQATQALDLAESALSKKLQEREAKDRLAAGVNDKAPAAYQQQVDNYFKALATRKKP